MASVNCAACQIVPFCLPYLPALFSLSKGMREKKFVTLSHFHRKSLQLASLLKSIEFETMNEWRKTKQVK